MIWIQGKLVSEDIVREDFVCNLQACKGACCHEGDFGAPLLEEEREQLTNILEAIKPYLTEEGKKAIDDAGPITWFEEAGDYGTTLIDNGPCAYMIRDENGIAACGIEKAWEAGATEFRKPVSCHLYPVRVKEKKEVDFTALNYDRWEICHAACALGKTLKVPVYRFVKEALVRRFGESFYDELEAAARHLEEQG